MTELLSLRRIADARRTVLSSARRYELHYASGEHRVVTLRQMDTILNGRSVPADFWAVVSAADAAFAAGDRDVLIEWPSGRRLNSA